MTTIRFDAKARALAQQTGLDKLGQAKLKQLDKNEDGVVTLTDVRRLVKDAALDKDQSLSRADRTRIDAALGGKPTTSTTATTGPSSVVATMTGGKKTLADTYIATEIKGTASGLAIKIDGGLWSGGGHIGDKSKAMTLKGFDVAAVDVLFYGTDGKTGLPNSSGGPDKGFIGTCFAGGMAVLVADKARGLTLIDVAARDFLDGKQPPHTKLLSPADIAKAPAVRAFVKKNGLDPKDLKVELKDVWMSGAFQDSAVNTLAFEVKLTDKKGKSKTQTFSTYLEGNLAKSFDKLELEKLELGVEHSWGYLLPPSAKPKKDKTTGTGGTGGAGGTGGGEGVVHHHGGTGGGEGVHVHHHTGGGEGVYTPSYPSSGGGE